MRHLACAAVIGLSTAAILAPVSPSHAASADPTGYWMKPDAERESKIQVFKCGSKKTNLCAKIAWIKEPLDSKGNPLHDVRNENPSLRGRPIMGLAIFSQLAPSAPSTWTGKIYNPEDGHTYSATLTVVSRKQILLKGCKAWLLCGERMWYRTSPPPAEVIPEAPAEGTQQIEASVTPPMKPAAPSGAEAAVAAAQAAPSAEAPVAKASIDAAAAQQEMQAMTAPQAPAEPTPAEAALVAPAAAAEPASPAPAAQEIAAPVAPPAEVDAGYGYGFLNIAARPEATAPQSGENVANMMLMAKPIATESAAPSTAQPAATKASTVPSVQPSPLPAPAAKPKAQQKPVATAAVKPAAAPAAKTIATPAAKPVATAAPKPLATPAAKPVATAATKPAPKPATQANPADEAALPPQEGDVIEVDPETGEPIPAETADATLIEPIPLTRRERRLLRKQQRDLEQGAALPWLR